LIVAQQISRELNDNGLLVPMVDNMQRECGEPPGQVSADSGFFSLDNLEVMEERAIDAYVPDSNRAGVLHHGGTRKQPTRHAALLRMRSKLASTTGRALYRRRKALAEPVIGERAARNAAIPDPRAEKSSCRVCAGNHGVEHDADVAAQQAQENVPRRADPHRKAHNFAG
jgi:hypothetical protein